MSRSGAENADNDNSNFRNNIIMAEGKLNPPANSATGNNKPSNAISNVEHFVSVTTKPKDSDSFVNLDDVNIMTRTSVEAANVEGDNPDSRNRGRKPINYAAKKTVAQGMIDIALLTSNANQLKSLFDYQRGTSTFYVILIMIMLSLTLQISVGVLLIFKGRYHKKSNDKAAATRVNNWVMSAVFVITVVNIFIAVFSTSPAVQPTSPVVAGVTTQPSAAGS